MHNARDMGQLRALGNFDKASRDTLEVNVQRHFRCGVIGAHGYFVTVQPAGGIVEAAPPTDFVGVYSHHPRLWKSFALHASLGNDHLRLSYVVSPFGLCLSFTTELTDLA